MRRTRGGGCRRSHRRFTAGGMGQRQMLSRLQTVLDFLAGRISGGNTPDEAVELVRQLKLTKLLLKVTVQRSLGPVQVLIPPEATEQDLIAATLRQYAKEARRPVLSSDAPSFDLHYSQFSLETIGVGVKKLLSLPKGCGIRCGGKWWHRVNVFELFKGS